MPWGGQINNGPCGFLMECCNYFLPLQLKCNSILPIYHLYDSEKKHPECLLFCSCLIPCLHHVSLFLLIENSCSPFLSPSDCLEWWPFHSGTQEQRWKITTFSFLYFGKQLATLWIGVQVRFEKQGSSIKNNLRGRLFLELYCLILFNIYLLLKIHFTYQPHFPLPPLLLLRSTSPQLSPITPQKG